MTGRETGLSGFMTGAACFDRDKRFFHEEHKTPDGAFTWCGLTKLCGTKERLE